MQNITYKKISEVKCIVTKKIIIIIMMTMIIVLYQTDYFNLKETKIYYILQSWEKLWKKVWRSVLIGFPRSSGDQLKLPYSRHRGDGYS